MIKDSAILFVALLVQLTVVFGSSYLTHRYFRRNSSDREMIRRGARLFGVFAATFVFFALLFIQILKEDSWVWVFIAPVWIITVFIAHDFALGLVIKKSNKPETGTSNRPAD